MTKDTFFANFGYLADAPYGVQKLRELILQLAVQGKLVPQDPNDEPASKLLDLMRAEKVRLLKEKKIRKADPLPPVNGDEAPYELPKGWEWSRLAEIGQIIGGGTPSSNNTEFFADKGIPWLTPADLYGIKSKYISRGKRDLTELGLRKSSAQLMPKGTILFSSRAPIGYVAIAQNQVSTNQGFKSCVPFIPEMNEYIYWFLRCVAKEIDSKAPGTTFKEVSGKIFGNVKIAVPPLAEQRRIAAKVDQLMNLCDELETRQQKKKQKLVTLNNAALDRLLTAREPDDLATAWRLIRDNFDFLYTAPETIGKLRQSILQLAVQGKLTPQYPNEEPASVLLAKIKAEKEQLVKEKKIKKSAPLPPVIPEEAPYKLPKGWEWVRWDSIAMKIGDLNHKMPEQVADGFPYVSPRDFLPNNKINLEGAKRISREDFLKLAEKIQPQKGDIIYPRYGTIGENRLVETEESFLASYSCCVIKTMHGFIEPKYQFIFSVSKVARDQAKEAENKTTQANVGIKSIQNYLVPLPPFAEQHRIVTKVDQLMKLCDELETKLIKSQTKSEKLVEAAVKVIASK